MQAPSDDDHHQVKPNTTLPSTCTMSHERHLNKRQPHVCMSRGSGNSLHCSCRSNPVITNPIVLHDRNQESGEAEGVETVAVASILENLQRSSKMHTMVEPSWLPERSNTHGRTNVEESKSPTKLSNSGMQLDHDSTPAISSSFTPLRPASASGCSLSPMPMSDSSSHLRPSATAVRVPSPSSSRLTRSLASPANIMHATTPSPSLLDQVEYDSRSTTAHMYRRFHSCFIPKSNASVSLAEAVRSYAVKHQKHFKRLKNGVQFRLEVGPGRELRPNDAEGHRLRRELSDLLATAFANDAGSPLMNTHAVAVTILQLDPDAEAQLPHYDSNDPRNRTAILYCSTGMSTFVVHLGSEEQHRLFQKYAIEKTTVPVPPHARQFNSWTVKPGDIQLFDHICLHFGPSHPRNATEKRLAVFVMYSPLHGPSQDYFQVNVPAASPSPAKHDAVVMGRTIESTTVSCFGKEEEVDLSGKIVSPDSGERHAKRRTVSQNDSTTRGEQ